ncbi:SusD/RagB family nutrient-binding outer membrane lipoprotein [Rufibacter sp. LB8]|uniref:SusD/RagB family nutrient-binding outer membrane lipoprotein n=1 Tax=Rufibacter sp. LB8 TaxID=2777781 RepID=UPI00178C5628|nr:SusD/RagB family nutrient-binding outer membrane lipoprotein [Rufibacter sp. LB8]
MKKIFIVMVACLSLVGSCTEFDDDLNITPNSPANASGMQLLANAMLSLPGLSSSPQGEFMAQFLAETQYPTASLYPSGGTSFYGLYQGPLMNIETALTSKDLNAVQGPVANQLAVAKILKAYYFWHITDRWGDVPYSEALKGNTEFTPKYDTQESIYNSLFILLKEANDQIVPGAVTNDIIYAGDMTKWKKLGNTIRLLMALRISKVNPNKGNTEFNAALADGVMTANADNFVFKHLADANNQNYWFGEVSRGREWWALTKTLVDYMKPVSDPRLPVYGQPTKSTREYIGLPFGTTAGMPNVSNYSLLGTAISAQNAPVYLVTYAQVLFARAEAAKLGWITGGDAEAKTNYDNAIRNSVAQWTVTPAGVTPVVTAADALAAANTLLAQPGVTYDPARAMEQIGTQRWIHLFMHGYEAWAEWRRTGYPNNLIPSGGNNVPTRQMYPSNEVFLNAENYTAAAKGGDTMYGKVWWDVD